MHNVRGAGLATVLLVMAVLGTIALTLASSTTFHLRLATRQSSGAQARNLAESVLALAVDRLVEQRDFGAVPTSDSHNITVQFSPSAPVGRLSFHPAQASNWGIPVSVNNLGNDQSVVLADGRTLPPFSAYLVSRAEYGGVTKLLESVITIPIYKYALATSGKVVSNGRLLVASIDSDTDLSGGLSAIPPEDLKPGHLAAQSTEQSVLDAASPTNATLITGDVVSGGTVTLGTYADVQGSIKQNHEPEELPDISVSDYDPAGWTGLETISSSQMTGPNPMTPVELAGVWRRQGDLDIYGELELDGGYLYVNGNLNITGGVIGKGAIFSTGNISIGNASGFVSDNVQALVAEGDISISGGNSTADRNNSFFSGVLFGKGEMNLSNVTVVGSVINNSANPDSTLELNNVGLLSNPEVLQFDFGMPGKVTTVFNGHSDNQFGIYPNSEDIGTHFDETQDRYVTPHPSSLSYRVYRTGGMDWLRPSEYQFIGIYDNAEDIRQGVADYMGSEWLEETETIEGLEAYWDYLNELLININELYQQTKHESLQRGEFTLEPNQFLPFEDRVRVIWSREIMTD